MTTSWDVTVQGLTVVLELEVDGRLLSIPMTVDEADELVSALTDALIECDLATCDKDDEDEAA